jgi:hypothetical protein
MVAFFTPPENRISIGKSAGGSERQNTEEELEIANEESNVMNTFPSFFSKNRIRCGLTMIALGAVLIAVQQRMSLRHLPAVRSASRAPGQETRTLPDTAAEAKLPQVEIPVAAAPKESSPILAEANVVAPSSPTSVSAPAQETVVVSTVPGQTIAAPLAHAVPATSSAASVGVTSSGNTEIRRVDPPLAFTAVPQDLTSEQRTALARIQNLFLDAIGDANQNPADPAYTKRWVDAQYTADQAFKAFFGWTAFSQMQLERTRNSYTEIQVP